MVNPQYQALFRGRDLLGKPFLAALPELRDQPFAGRLQNVLETGIPYVGHEELARHASEPGGPIEDRYYDFTYVRLEDDQGGSLGVYDHAVDVTERVRARLQAEKTAAALHASVVELEEERELREKFVATLTHDLRTPITGAKLMAQLIERHAGGSAEIARKAQRIKASMDRADGMIRDLLDASRIKAGITLALKPSQCDLSEVARATVEELTVIYGNRFELSASAPLLGAWDETAVRRILENLATNAVKYGAKDQPIKIMVHAVNDEAELSVRNEGNPIPAESQRDLFRLFRRSDAAEAGKQEGWGIGLSLVHGLAIAHGGNVGVNSNPQIGTTFWIRIRPL
jgi:signal transduction histidine kinase